MDDLKELFTMAGLALGISATVTAKRHLSPDSADLPHADGHSLEL